MNSIVEQMEEVSAAARCRMAAAAHTPGIQYAEILFMDQSELAEFMRLRLLLPSYGQEVFEANQRIIKKIVKRRMLKFSKED